MIRLVVPADVPVACGTAVYYGPPQPYGPQLSKCQNDADCIDVHGAGWHCDKGDPCTPMC
jgi:hypothetical protein